ncbi:MAG: hypothetical protein ABFC77_00325 [Thermoguttaceae bacterium]
MADELMRVGLQRLQDRFLKAVEAGHQLQCCLIEWSAMDGAPQGDPPGFSGKNPVKWATGVYRMQGVICDQTGLPTFSDTLTYDLNGKPITNSEGQPYAIDRGAIRAIYLYGTHEMLHSLKPILGDAGHLLASIPPATFPIAIPRVTLRTDDVMRRWLYLLFDLAWANIGGSPLRVSEDKSAWYENTSVALDTVRLFRGPNKPTGFGAEENLLSHIPDPPPWYSTIADVAQSSVYALDILLTLPPQPMPYDPTILEALQQLTSGTPEAANGNGKSASPRAAETKPSEVNGGAGSASAKSEDGKPARHERGRPVDTDIKEDKRIYEAWKTGQYKRQSDCDVALGLSAGKTYAACEWHRHRLTRRRKNHRTK